MDEEEIDFLTDVRFGAERTGASNDGNIDAGDPDWWNLDAE